MDHLVDGLPATVTACRRLIVERFPEPEHAGAAAVLLDDGRVLTGTSADFPNPSTTVCHELEPFLAAHRLDRRIRASICLHRTPEGRHLVLSPCGVCRERLALHGPEVLVAVPAPDDLERVEWITLREALPHYWLRAFPEDLPAGW